MASDSLRPVTLAELVATLSLVADLGMGRPMERVLRQTVVAMRLGAAAGLDQPACSSAGAAAPPAAACLAIQSVRSFLIMSLPSV